MWSDISKQGYEIIRREPCGQLENGYSVTLVDWKQKRLWPDQVRGYSEQRAPLAARLKNQPEIPILEIPKAPMDQPRRCTTGAATEITLVDQRRPKSPHRRVPGDAGTRYAPTNDQEVNRTRGHISDVLVSCSLRKA
jgi:hypothetical protein